MAGVRRNVATPGEFRRSQNWIGQAGSTPATAAYIPPPPVEMTGCLDHLEKFLHETVLPPLVQVALAHYQFEAIHPFLDGNGRVGRLLVTLFLMAVGDRRYFLQDACAPPGAPFRESVSDGSDGGPGNGNGVHDGATRHGETGILVHRYRGQRRETGSRILRQSSDGNPRRTREDRSLRRNGRMEFHATTRTSSGKSASRGRASSLSVRDDRGREDA